MSFNVPSHNFLSNWTIFNKNIFYFIFFFI